VEKITDGYVWVTWTVCGGEHVKNFCCSVDKEGNLISGRINCFGLGWMHIDEAYLEALFEEMADDKIEWDEIAR